MNEVSQKNTSKTLLLLLFIGIFVVYLVSPIITSYDSHWTIHTGLSIIHEGNVDIDEYMQSESDLQHFAIEKINSHYYTIFPAGTSILSLPFIAIAEIIYDPLMNIFPQMEDVFKSKLAEHNVIVNELEFIHVYPAVELVIASFYTALSGIFILLIARVYLPKKQSLLVLFIFAFCTSSWSVSSRALWQHGPSVFMLSIALYLLLREKFKNGYIHYVAIPLALAFIIRPTNAIPVFFISLYVLIYYKGYFLRFIALALPFIVFFFIYNWIVYDHFFSNYMQLSRVFHSKDFLEALIGNLISPSRGLFIYSPILLMSFYGFKTKNNILSVIFLSIIICHWLLISSFPHWWAGHSYGPRFFTDMLPFFMYFLVQAFSRLNQSPKYNRKMVYLLITPLLLFSLFVHYQGAFNHSVYKWNSSPVDVDDAPKRVWNWHDMQMFRK